MANLKHIKGDASFERKMKMLANPTKVIARGMHNYVEGYLPDEIVPYPPESQANRKPGINGRWYERGIGTKTITGKVYKNSLKMDKKWKFSTRVQGNKVRGKIINLATYSIYVQGEEQVRYHAARGWKRADKVVDDSLDKGAEFVRKEMDKELSK